ncbi:MAG: GAF domain-containing protein [Deltaproteobacteria bacterium]|nr:GAF domain-containing protein [Deltaproteobacteria bacterium]
MKWEVSIPAAKGRTAPATVSVEAENWLAALKAGLSRSGEKGGLASSFQCDIREDHSVRVTDFERRCVYLLRPVGDGSAAAPSRSSQAVVEERSFTPAKARSVAIPADVVPHRPSSKPSQQVVTAPPVATPPAPPRATARKSAAAPATRPVPSPPPAAQAARAPTGPTLPTHQIFARRDENPDAGNPLTYRDRLFSVPVGTKAEDAVVLLRYYFGEIQLEIAPNPPGKFINLAVFDHAFRGRPERPAIAALSWKDWRGADPEITFPAAVPVPKSPTPARGVVAVTPVERRRRSSHEIPAVDAGTDERLAEVFDAMQDLFLQGTQRDAAAFALDLAMQKIECEAGSTVLSDIDRGDLFFAAVRGPASERLLGVRLETGVGIVGAAAKIGETIAITDVTKDARFYADFDKMTGFVTRTLLCAPLDFEGRALGAIELLNKKGGAFNQGDINVLSYIAENLGNFVATALPDSDEPPTVEPDGGARPKTR